MTPNQCINNYISKLIEEHSHVLLIIENKLNQSKYLGGRLKINLDCAIDSKCFNDLKIIYQHQGWKYATFNNRIINNKFCTVINLDNYE